jgi:hypothetical protein
MVAERTSDSIALRVKLLTPMDRILPVFATRVSSAAQVSAMGISASWTLLETGSVGERAVLE